mmetsp:Transcript_63862/g.109641  ORF Transcript_63862/g.109641 Transcript_63862/m.109641 type:complete len:618 (-) Transcript_63862:210-2063(-)
MLLSAESQGILNALDFIVTRSRQGGSDLAAAKQYLEFRLLTLEAELQFSNTQLQSSKQALCAAAKGSLKPDVRLVANDGTVFLMDEPALKQTSPYFAGLLGGGFAEQESRVVKFDDVEPAALECVCMAIRCGAHPEAAFESCPPAVLAKTLELCVRIQLPDTIVGANADAIIAKLFDLDVPVVLDLLAASELHLENGAENLRSTWEDIKDTAMQAITLKLEEATDAQLGTLSADQLLLVVEMIARRKLDPVTVTSPEVSEKHTKSGMLPFGNLGFKVRISCNKNSLAIYPYSSHACFMGATEISLVSPSGSTNNTVTRKSADAWMDGRGFNYCASFKIKDFLHEDGRLHFSISIHLAELGRKANLIVKWVSMQERYEGPKTPCHALRWLALVLSAGSGGHATSAEKMSSVLVEYTAHSFFAQKDLYALPAIVFVEVLKNSCLRTARFITDECEMHVLCAVLDWALKNNRAIAVGDDDQIKTTGKTVKVFFRPKGKYEIMHEGEDEPKKNEMVRVSTEISMLLEHVRFPYIHLAELTNNLSAPQWEMLNSSPKFKELGEQATEFQIKKRSLASPGSGDLGKRHQKRARQASDIPSLTASQIFGGLIGQRQDTASVVSP